MPRIDKLKGAAMPYSHIEELPNAMKKNLPTGAMEVYLSAYLQAWNTSARAKDSLLEQIAHRKAWEAVKDKFRKQGHEWVRIYG
jgi:cation transport regulator